jgi:hypothetical protein
MMMNTLCHLLLPMHAEWQGKAVNAYEALPVPVKGSLTLPEPPSNAAPDQLCAHWQRVHTAVEDLSQTLQQVRWCCMILLCWGGGVGSMPCMEGGTTGYNRVCRTYCSWPHFVNRAMIQFCVP